MLTFSIQLQKVGFKKNILFSFIYVYVYMSSSDSWNWS